MVLYKFDLADYFKYKDFQPLLWQLTHMLREFATWWNALIHTLLCSKNPPHGAYLYAFYTQAF